LTPRYIFIQTARNLRQTWGTQIMTLLTISLSVFMFAFFTLIYLNMVRTGEQLADHVRLIVYLDHEVVPEMQARMEKKITDFAAVEKIIFNSSQDAFTNLSKQLGEDQDVLVDLGPDFLPPSIEVFPKRDLQTLTHIKEFSEYLTTLPGAKKVQYGREWIERFGSFTQLLQVIVFLSGALLALTATFMVASTIRHTVVSRQDELEILQLLGASQAYFQTPLLIEGILQGISGSTLGLACLYGLYTWIKSRFSGPDFLEMLSFTFLPIPMTCTILGVSLSLCIVGSYISIRKFLRI